MSASSSDSWILVALTILVVLLLFYLSKKMICNSHYGGDESPTISTSSSSTSSASFHSASNSNSTTSYSDYYYGGGGTSPFDPTEVSSPGTSADEFHEVDLVYSADHRRHNSPNQNESWMRDSRHATNNNNDDTINNLNLRDTITSLSGRGFDSSTSLSSSSRGGGVGVGSGRSNPRGIGCDGGQSTGNFYGNGANPPPPISIISGEDMLRKMLLEGQLRNQITKIVYAEREIQRLVQLLAMEQGLDPRQYCTAAEALPVVDHHRSVRSGVQLNHHRTFALIPRAPDSNRTSGPRASIVLAPSQVANNAQRSEETTAEATVQNPAQSIARQSVLPLKHNENPSLSHAPRSTSLPAKVNNEVDEEDSGVLSDTPQNCRQNVASEEVTVSGNYPQHDEVNETLAGLRTSPQNEELVPEPEQATSLPSSSPPPPPQPLPPVPLEASTTSTSGIDQGSQFTTSRAGGSLLTSSHSHQQQQQYHCQCNLCCSAATSTSTVASSSSRMRRMLLLRQMLFPLSTSFQVGNDTHLHPPHPHHHDPSQGGGRTGTSDLLSRPLPPLTSCLHYPYHEGGIPRYGYLQGSPDYWEDDPPTYEECIRSEGPTSHNNSNNRDQTQPNINNQAISQNEEGKHSGLGS